MDLIILLIYFDDNICLFNFSDVFDLHLLINMIYCLKNNKNYTLFSIKIEDFVTNNYSEFISMKQLFSLFMIELIDNQNVYDAKKINSICKNCLNHNDIELKYIYNFPYTIMAYIKKISLVFNNNKQIKKDIAINCAMRIMIPIIKGVDY